MYDVIVIGGGPGGVSAAIYLVRFGYKVLVVHNGANALKNAKKIENYYGVESISGEELYEKGIDQALKLGVEVKKEEVVDVSFEGDFVVTTTNRYEAKKVVLATGKTRKMPKIDGLLELKGEGVSTCAVCDGFFFRGREVAVIGSGKYALHEADVLKPLACKVTILTDNNKIDADFDYEVIQEKIKKVYKDGEKIKVDFGEQTFEFDGIFIAVQTGGSSEFCEKLGALTLDGKVVVNGKMETNIKGLYAIGDCTGGILQISKAVSDGTICAYAIKEG